MNCPNCGSGMVEFRSVGSNPAQEAILERCEKCGGEWLGVNNQTGSTQKVIKNNFSKKRRLSLKEILRDDGRQVYLLLFAGLIMLPAWFIPGGRFFLYPLSLIGTWFHEFGHAIVATLLGGFMLNMQIHGLSGITYFVLPFGTNLRHSLVAAGGPMMPSILGALLIMSGRNSFLSKMACKVLAVAMIATVIISLGQPSIGMVMILLIAMLIFKISSNLDAKVLQLLVHILGIQAVFSILRTFDYLSKSNAGTDARPFTSDTGLIEKYTGIPTFFWAILLTGLSLALLLFAFLFSFGLIFKKREKI